MLQQVDPSQPPISILQVSSRSAINAHEYEQCQQGSLQPRKGVIWLHLAVTRSGKLKVQRKADKGYNGRRADTLRCNRGSPIIFCIQQACNASGLAASGSAGHTLVKRSSEIAALASSHSAGVGFGISKRHAQLRLLQAQPSFFSFLGLLSFLGLSSFSCSSWWGSLHSGTRPCSSSARAPSHACGISLASGIPPHVRCMVSLL